MNAPVRTLEIAGDLEDFEDCADYFAWCWHSGILDKLDAVDGAQHHAVLWGMVDAFGQDEIQRIMVCAFEFADPLPNNYAAQLLKSWELADPRDAWRHTGELPPPTEIRNGPLEGARGRNPEYRTPQSTIDAFLYVASLDDPDHLARWLAGHKRDAPYLLKIWKAKRC